MPLPHLKYKLWLEVEVTDEYEEYDEEEILEPYCVGHYSDESIGELLNDMAQISEEMGELDQSYEILALSPIRINADALKLLEAQDKAQGD